MARLARVVVPHCPHHVTQRGNRNLEVFLRDEDYETYIDLVADACKSASTEVWAYCLMPNHVHMIMVPQDSGGLRAALGEAHRRYTRHVNSREGWQGHLWQERFHSFPMEEPHLMAAARYIERNPVAAGLCQHPEQWRWSSAGAHLRAEDDKLVRVSPMLEQVGDWRTYLDQANDKASDKVEAQTLERHLRTGRPLGSNEFVESVGKRLKRSLKPGKPGPKPKKTRK
jgi:putative transposase